jgi:hypothetical protein
MVAGAPRWSGACGSAKGSVGLRQLVMAHAHHLQGFSPDEQHGVMAQRVATLTGRARLRVQNLS